MDLYTAIKRAQEERDKAYRQRDLAYSRIADLENEIDRLRSGKEKPRRAVVYLEEVE